MDAAEDLEPGSSAAMLLWEDVWAAELAAAMRGAGGELVAIGRIPHDVVRRRARSRCPPPTPHRRVDMFRRRGGLVRAAATTAVVAGTAGAVRHRQDQKYAAQDQEAYDQQMAAAAGSAAAPAAPAQPDYTAELAQLAQLKAPGDPHRGGVRGEEEADPRDLIRAQRPTKGRNSARSQLSVPRRPLDDVHLLPVRDLDLDPDHGVRGHLPPEGHRRAGTKALWIIFVIILPYLGVFIYLIANHDGMADRNIAKMQQQQQATDQYIRSVAGGAAGGDREGQGPPRLRRDHTGRVRLDQGEGAGLRLARRRERRGAAAPLRSRRLGNAR